MPLDRETSVLLADSVHEFIIISFKIVDVESNFNCLEIYVSDIMVGIQNEMMYYWLTEIKTREERSKLYFDEDSSLDQSMTSSNLMDLWQEHDSDLIDRQFEISRPGVSKTQQQLLLMEEDNSAQSRIRSQQVDHIVKSIVDLNHLFKDLSHMIVHQVTRPFLLLKAPCLCRPN